MLKKIVCIYIWVSRFEAEPFTVNGELKTFGSYQQAQTFIETNGLPSTAAAVEIYQSS